MKKILCLMISLFALSSVCLAADFDGYIVKISENTAGLLSEKISFYGGASLMGELSDSETVEMLADELSDVREVNSDHLLIKAEDENALQTLIDLGIVEYYEENIYYQLLGYDVEANANYADQKWYLDYINTDFAWNAGIYGSEVRVAVIDSGVHAHSDIKKNLIPGENYVDVETLGSSYTEDNSDHGTRVAGIIAAECNDLSTVGISFKTKIVPLKVTDGNSVSIDSAVQAIIDAVDYYGCDVINLSFGDTSDSTSLRNAIKYAIDNNVIVVAAAGNSGDTGYIYPAAYSEVVSVANAEHKNSSLYIRDSSQRNDMVDIAAPGTLLHTITNSDSVSDDKSGTSFSCPVISAVAALVKSVQPEITQSEFEELIKMSADSSYLASSGQSSTAWGAGLVDIEAIFTNLFMEQGYYISENVTVNGEALAYVTNMSKTEAVESCTVIISERNSDGILNVEYLSFVIAPATSVEICLSELGFSSSAALRVVLDRVPGDVNGDGTVNVRDASLILRYLAGYNVVADTSMMDVNGDGDISVRDASAILRFCAGYNVELH